MLRRKISRWMMSQVKFQVKRKQAYVTVVNRFK